MFTVEEITLLRSFDTSTRRAAIKSIMYDFWMTEDEELIERFCCVIKKLRKITDAEFNRIDFTVYDNDDVNETGSADEVPGREKEADNE